MQDTKQVEETTSFSLFTSGNETATKQEPVQEIKNEKIGKSKHMSWEEKKKNRNASRKKNSDPTHQ
jgi:hypothetical protein